MSTPSRTDDSLSSARQRIAAAYDPALLPRIGDVLSHSLSSHLQNVLADDSPVLNWNTPQDNIKTVAETLHNPLHGALTPDQITARFRELVQLTLGRGHNLHSPRYVGHQVPAPIPVAGYFDAIGAVTNQVNAIYEMGPWITAVERAMGDELTPYLGWTPAESTSIVTHGGSIANLTGLLAARNVTLPGAWEHGLSNHVKPVLVCQADAHYSVARAAGILGFGTHQVVKAPLDDRRRMDPQKLRELLQNLRASGSTVVAVVACACSTPIGAFDPLDDIAAICAEFGIWMHVDAAHGAAALLSPKHKHLVSGLGRADTLVWDAHKMMFVPALCAFLFYKNRAHSYEAFRQEAPYLFDPSALGLAEYDGGLRTLECTKRAVALGLWGTWSVFGPQLFSDLVDVTFDLGRQFYELLQVADDFMPLHEPQCNIVTFGYRPPQLRDSSSEVRAQFLRETRTRLAHSGKFYLVQTSLNGEAALRVTLINPLTTRAHLRQLLESLRETGEAVLQTLRI